MKKSYKLFLILFFITVNIHSQTESEPQQLTKNDTFSRNEFSKILNLHFSKIITGNNFTNFGNYASVKSTDESLKISASFLNKRGNIISIEGSGGATEGVAGFFNDGDLNTNISIKATFHKLINPFSNNTIKRNSFERDKLREELKKAEDAYRVDMISIKHKKELLDLRVKTAKAEIKKNAINDSLKAVMVRLKKSTSDKQLT